MKIAVACDHGGFAIKDIVKDVLKRNGCEVVDLGTDSPSAVDYPDTARPALEMLVRGECDRIVLMCGTGIGMSICANRIPGVRGTVCHDNFTARMARMHNDSNCLILGARVLGPAIVQDIVEIWIETEFEGGRHQTRLDKINAQCVETK